MTWSSDRECELRLLHLSWFAASRSGQEPEDHKTLTMQRNPNQIFLPPDHRLIWISEIYGISVYILFLQVG